MSASATLETGLLNLIFNNIDLANIGDAGGLQNSVAEGSFWVALYTDDPTDADVGTETVYTNYARVAVARNSGGWTIAGNNVSNTALVAFPQCGATGATITHWGLRTASTLGDLLYHGALSASLAVSNGSTPEFGIGALDINID